ncbi:MAG: TolC family protein [Deltaproteobacteria bacterium]|nr:TolC family protein [Deltaproteobacteria bacterium]
MSAKLLRTGAVILVAGLSWPNFALAFDPIYPFTDPLLTMPEVVEQGVILPGDTAPIPCSIQKDFSHPLALGEAVDLALCNNPQIRSTWADIKIQAGAVGEARATYLPALTGSLSRTSDRIRYSDSRYPSSNINRNTAQGGLTWRIFDFGGRAANHQAAESLLAAAMATHNGTLQKALSSVIQAYFDAVTAGATLKAKTTSEEIAGNTLHSAKLREEKGASSQSDTLQATTALAKSSLEKNRALGEYEKARSVLGYILGIPANTVVSLPEDLGESAGENGKALSQWLEETQKNHPAILAAKNQLEAAKKRVTVARSAGMPTLNFSTNYYQNTRPGEAVTSIEAQETTMGLALSIPIFEGFSTTYKVRGAQAQVEQKEAALADTEHQIAMELIKAHADATSALQNLDASAILLEAAQKALVVSQRKYDKGAADIIELLNTQGALSDAQNQRIRCLADWRSARLRLLASAGQIGRSAVTE